MSSGAWKSINGQVTFSLRMDALDRELFESVLKFTRSEKFGYRSMKLGEFLVEAGRVYANQLLRDPKSSKAS